MANEEEIVRILLSASATISSMLIAIIGVLLSQYVMLKNKPEPGFALQPYHRLLWVMVVGLVLGALSTIFCLAYLLNADIFYAIIGLFVALVATVVLGVFYTVMKILGGTRG